MAPLLALLLSLTVFVLALVPVLSGTASDPGTGTEAAGEAGPFDRLLALERRVNRLSLALPGVGPTQLTARVPAAAGPDERLAVLAEGIRVLADGSRRSRGRWPQYDVTAKADEMRALKARLQDPGTRLDQRLEIYREFSSFSAAMFDRELAAMWLHDYWRLQDPRQRAGFILGGRHLIGWDPRIRDQLILEVLGDGDLELRQTAGAVLTRLFGDPRVQELMEALARGPRDTPLRRQGRSFTSRSLWK